MGSAAEGTSAAEIEDPRPRSSAASRREQQIDLEDPKQRKAFLLEDLSKVESKYHADEPPQAEANPSNTTASTTWKEATWSEARCLPHCRTYLDCTVYKNLSSLIDREWGPLSWRFDTYTGQRV